MKTPDSLNVTIAKQQVKEFCKNIEIWFNGTASGKDTLYQRISTSFDSSFAMITGDGNEINYQTFLTWLTSVYGQFPTRKIQVSDLKGYSTSHHVLVQFTEAQFTDDLITKRQSSAVFVIHQKKALWYHLVEQWAV
ncbi:hypothetical protein [Pedobacter nutrimenti]|uniref:SnoaL-like protein n=1 Tax=Pedobacter nutrimenti TaxID=1241337 RepID=A0A318UEA3_9SPHI|nr:hypothetical protein [Pedobacter nutrimenti]PYF74702.1 hypothetical protein B0O44_103148 [Pedobacter nutrimenti]